MNFYHRRSFFVVFTVFFVITTPLIIIYSLGFDINYKETQIQNSLSLRIRTSTPDSVISIDKKQVSKNNFDGNITAGSTSEVLIESPNFYNESIVFSTDKNDNSIIDLSGITLLPKTGDFLQKTSDVVQIISTSDLITKQVGKFYIQQYSPSGYSSTPKLITSNPVLSGKIQQYTEPDPDQIITLEDKSTPWKKLNSKLFYKNGQILSLTSDIWVISSISVFDSKIKNVSFVDNQSLLILDEKGSLWLYNYKTNIATFVDGGYSNFFERENSNQIWLWKNESIFKTEISEIINQRSSLDKFLQFKYPKFAQEDTSKFQILNTYQGYILRAGSTLMYIPDSKPNQWEIISTQAKSLTTSSSHAFWIDAGNQLLSYDFNNNYQKIISEVQDGSITLEYSKESNRLFLYYPKSVVSIWENKDIPNKPIVKRTVQPWVTNQNCYPLLLEKTLYCEQSGNLVSYNFRSQI
jgi:hypothetical protein